MPDYYYLESKRTCPAPVSSSQVLGTPYRMGALCFFVREKLHLLCNYCPLRASSQGLALASTYPCERKMASTSAALVSNRPFAKSSKQCCNVILRSKGSVLRQRQRIKHAVETRGVEEHLRISQTIIGDELWPPRDTTIHFQATVIVHAVRTNVVRLPMSSLQPAISGTNFFSPQDCNKPLYGHHSAAKIETEQEREPMQELSTKNLLLSQGMFGIGVQSSNTYIIPTESHPKGQKNALPH